MRLLFFGPQGSGKGTQASLIANKFSIPHISTGDLLRCATGEQKKKVDEYMNAGKLVPSEVTIALLKERLEKEDCKKGFILDGFPRNEIQAKALEGITKIDYAIEIDLSDDEAVKRIGSRVTCSRCGTVYSLIVNKPKKEGVCDKCSGELIKRADDTEEAIRKRLSIYHQETKPLLNRYRLIRVNGDQEIEDVNSDIEIALKA